LPQLVGIFAFDELGDYAAVIIFFYIFDYVILLFLSLQIPER
jgi:hypothetical protein